MELIDQNKRCAGMIISALRKGKVLILATDTVYGLVCDAKNKKAVEKIFEIKKRDKLNPVGIFVNNIKNIKKFAVVSKSQEEFFKNNRITGVLKAKNKILSPLVYKDKTIGIRIPNYEFLNYVLDEFNGPVAQTSANISDRPALTGIKDVLEQFKKEDVIIVNAGDLPANKPSRVVDLTKNIIKVIRK